MPEPTAKVDVVSFAEIKRHFTGRIPGWWIEEQAEAGNIPFLSIGARKVFSISAVEEAIRRMATSVAARPQVIRPVAVANG